MHHFKLYPLSNGNIPDLTLMNDYGESFMIRWRIESIHGFAPDGYWQCQNRKKMTRESESAQKNDTFKRMKFIKYSLTD